MFVRGGCQGLGMRLRGWLSGMRSRCPGMKLLSGPAGGIVFPGFGALLGDADGQAVLTDEL